MPRPFKCRCVGYGPKSNHFKPAGIPLTDIEEINLTIDEFEAVKLADLNGLYQEDAAKKMHISRQTFGNIIENARRKIADVIINAKSLKIEGGIYKMDGLKQFFTEGKKMCKKHQNCTNKEIK